MKTLRDTRESGAVPKHRTRPSIWETLLAALSLPAFAVFIFGQMTEPQLPVSVSGTIAMFLASAAVLAILGNVAWSFFNRRSYDKLKETIAELKESLASKELRYSEFKIASQEQETKLTLALAALTNEVQNLKVSNEALVGQNLQLKAQMKQFRDQGDVANE